MEYLHGNFSVCFHAVKKKKAYVSMYFLHFSNAHFPSQNDEMVNDPFMYHYVHKYSMCIEMS